MPQVPSPQMPTAGLPDVHRDSSRPPIVAGFDAGLSSVIPLGKPEIPAHPYEHRNTDQSMKIRFVVPSGPLNAGSPILALNFGTEYRTADHRPFQPVVVLNDSRFFVAQITSTGFQIATAVAIGAGTYDLFISSGGL